ncbi:MAG: winged helix-turn-helix domain-containing protein [Pseudomonadaceae bacterium]|nr:winged helix-turn-helix domain-containing protein [Pseudomonadaceae bacterium]
MTSEENSIKTEVYEFSGFALDVPARELWQAEERVEVQRRVLDLLIFLVRNRDRTVTKDELQDAVWPGTIVTEAALTRAVMKARKALGDSASAPTFVQTVHGEGYRFLAPVAVSDDVPARSTEPAVDASLRRSDLFRAATTYGAIAWLVNQAAAMVWEAFEWDKLPLQILLAVSIIGAPVLLGLVWFYRSTSTGLRRRSELSSNEGQGAHQRYRWTIGALALALVLSLAWNFKPAPTPADYLRIAVLPVANESGEGSLDWIELGLMGLVNSALLSGGLSTVASAEVLHLSPVDRDASQPLPLQRFATDSGAGQVLISSLQKVGEEFVVTGSLVSMDTHTALPGFTAETPAQAAANFAQHVIETLLPGPVAVESEFRTVDPFVNQAFARGLHALISGNLANAQDLLEVARAGAPEAFWPAYELAVVRQQRGDLEGAKNDLTRLLESHDASPVPAQQARLHNALGIIADLSGELPSALAHYIAGIDIARSHQLHEVRAKLWINHAVAERALGRPDAAAESLGRARAAYAAAGIEVISADFYIALGNTRADSGDVTGAQSAYRQALDNARLRDTPSVEGTALSNLSWAAERLSDYEAAESYLIESETLRRRIGDKVGLIRSQIRRANLLFYRGRLSDADAIAEAVLQDSYALSEPDLQSTAQAIRAEVALARGDAFDAARWFERSLVIEREGGTRYGLLRAGLGLSRAKLAADEVSAARAALAQMRADNSVDAHLPVFALRADRQEARILRAEGNLEAAGDTLRQAIDVARQRASDVHLARLASDLSELFVATDNLDDARIWLGVALEAEPSEPEVLLAKVRLAHAENRFDDLAAAASALEAVSGERYAREVSEL